MTNRTAMALSALLFGAMALPTLPMANAAVPSTYPAFGIFSEPQVHVIQSAPCNPKLTLCQ